MVVALPGDLVVIRVLDVIIRILIRVVIFVLFHVSVLVVIVESVSGVMVSVPVLLLFVISMTRVMLSDNMLNELLGVLIMDKLLVAHQVSTLMMDSRMRNFMNSVNGDDCFVNDGFMNDRHVVSGFIDVFSVWITVALVARVTLVIDRLVAA